MTAGIHWYNLGIYLKSHFIFCIIVSHVSPHCWSQLGGVRGGGLLRMAVAVAAAAAPPENQL